MERTILVKTRGLGFQLLIFRRRSAVETGLPVVLRDSPLGLHHPLSSIRFNADKASRLDFDTGLWTKS